MLLRLPVGLFLHRSRPGLFLCRSAHRQRDHVTRHNPISPTTGSGRADWRPTKMCVCVCVGRVLDVHRLYAFGTGRCMVVHMVRYVCVCAPACPGDTGVEGVGACMKAIGCSGTWPSSRAAASRSSAVTCRSRAGGHGRVIHAVAAPPRRIYAAEGTMAQRRQRALVVGLPGAGREHASSVDGESCVTGSCAPARADFACMPVDPFQQDNQSLRK